VQGPAHGWQRPFRREIYFERLRTCGLEPGGSPRYADTSEPCWRSAADSPRLSDSAHAGLQQLKCRPAPGGCGALIVVLREKAASADNLAQALPCLTLCTLKCRSTSCLHALPPRLADLPPPRNKARGGPQGGIRAPTSKSMS